MADQDYAEAAGLVLFNSGYVYRLLRREARALGIRWTGLMLLKDLEMQGSLTQRELVQIEQMSAPTISVLTRELEQAGWVRQVQDPEDRRSSRVSLTTKGRRQLEADGRRLQARLEERLRSLPARVLPALIRAETQLAGLFVSAS